MNQDFKVEKRGPRINEDIRVREVRVIVEGTGEQLGVIPTTKALEIAQNHGLDLVEVAETARPPVCKIMDYGDYKFKKAKAQREAKKSATRTEIKEIHLTPRIADHDLGLKAKKIREFLGDNHRVIVSVKFRGREKAHTDLGRELLNKLVGLLGEIANIDSPSKLESDKMIMVLTAKR